MGEACCGRGIIQGMSENLVLKDIYFPYLNCNSLRLISLIKLFCSLSMFKGRSEVYDLVA